MPKLIGNAPPKEAKQVVCGYTPDLIKLAYNQMILMPPEQIYYCLDTSDKGGPGRVAKRWYTWWARSKDILDNPRSTLKMRRAAGEFDQIARENATVKNTLFNQFMRAANEQTA